jgi:thioredoxin 2
MSERVNIVCGQCDSIVGVPAERLEQRPRCPKCHVALFSGHPVELQDENFDRHVTRTDVPVVVDFWAPWCGPCRAMAPHYEHAAQRMEPQLRFAKVNSDAAQQVSARFGIRSIPTLIVFRNGSEVARHSGAMDTPGLMRWLQQSLVGS